ncbi:putative DNA modification/repair radical SAM protein [Geoalkalibacter sp.]|uniref:putative DNA modification/repair radical SAM protein n=1 Tax=Geoalkalibacter sp. TaxID=3041440 RepID=UPI00272EE7A9|nr:putative DNA modification/repair radical SAM protein [Geoalkalibacter sp.]
MADSQSLEHKLAILAESAKYDASCSSSGSSRPQAGGLGNVARGGICHSWSADGRCISLLKILLSNACIYDCAYCVNRRGNDGPRATLSPAEVAEITVNFYRRNYIEGLFLSTGVIRDPDYTMEQLIAAARLLREEHRFGGYIHLKVVPGADPRRVEEAGRYADRVSVNIELPSAASLQHLAPDKGRAAILEPMDLAARLIAESRVERRKSRKAPRFAPAGQSTQLIVGASPENDRQILRLSESLYRRMDLKRVYYSAFVPVSADNRLPALAAPPLLREHRLYQADWLLRFYGFTAEDILSDLQPDLDTALDPKAGWALRNLHLFPVEVNRAEYELLLRVPGVGVRSARKILRARRGGSLDFDALRRLGIVLKRARYFLTAQGKYLGEADLAVSDLRARLLALPAPEAHRPRQLDLFAGIAEAEDHFAATVRGEL